MQLSPKIELLIVLWWLLSLRQTTRTGCGSRFVIRVPQWIQESNVFTLNAHSDPDSTNAHTSTNSHFVFTLLKNYRLVGIYSRDHWIAIFLCYMLHWGSTAELYTVVCGENSEKCRRKKLNSFSVHLTTSRIFRYFESIFFVFTWHCCHVCSYPHFIHFLCYPQKSCFVPFCAFQLFLYTRIPSQTQQHLGSLWLLISSRFFTLGECSG